MKVLVLGLWHLGCVTAASCAKHFEVIGVDLEAANVDALQRGQLPISEPGLEALFRQGIETGRLKIRGEVDESCSDVSVLWVTYDTPIDSDDRPNVDYVLNRLRGVLPSLSKETIVLISSQLPAGTCRRLEDEFPRRAFAYSPENLRLGRSLLDFNEPERVIVGCRAVEVRETLARLFEPFCANVIWMSSESAEMTKHAINAFLAVSVTFANEIARLCEQVGADGKEVESGLKSDMRIGPRAYLSPGAAFAGGTLARDVNSLTDLAVASGEKLCLIPAIKHSNDRHKVWPMERMRRQFETFRGRIFAVLGLTYKAGTNTLRRSQAVELCELLLGEGCEVRVFDPVVKELPAGMVCAVLAEDVGAAMSGADAVVVCTEWPEFLHLPWGRLVEEMRQPFVFDAGGFVRSVVSGGRAVYFSVGHKS